MTLNMKNYKGFDKKPYCSASVSLMVYCLLYMYDVVDYVILLYLGTDILSNKKCC